MYPVKIYNVFNILNFVDRESSNGYNKSKLHFAASVIIYVSNILVSFLNGRRWKLDPQHTFIILLLQYVAEPKVHSVQLALSTYANFQFSKKIPILQKLYLRTVPNCPNVCHVAQPKPEKHRWDPPTPRKWRNPKTTWFRFTNLHKPWTNHRPCYWS